jgi:hypothetical protein
VFRGVAWLFPSYVSWSAATIALTIAWLAAGAASIAWALSRPAPPPAATARPTRASSARRLDPEVVG